MRSLKSRNSLTIPKNCSQLETKFPNFQTLFPTASQASDFQTAPLLSHLRLPSRICVTWFLKAVIGIFAFELVPQDSLNAPWKQTRPSPGICVRMKDIPHWLQMCVGELSKLQGSAVYAPTFGSRAPTPRLSWAIAGSNPCPCSPESHLSSLSSSALLKHVGCASSLWILSTEHLLSVYPDSLPPACAISSFFSQYHPLIRSLNAARNLCVWVYMR